MLTSITITGSRSGCKRTEEKSEAKYHNEKKSSSLIASDFTLHLKVQKEKKKSGRVQGQKDNIRISKKNQQNKWMQININISFTISRNTKPKTQWNQYFYA